MKILIGADPEFFVSVDGEATPAAGLIPGTKSDPHPVKNGAVQVDGCALEFNINPAASVDEFLTNINAVKADLEGMVSAKMTGRRVSFLYQPVIQFDKRLFDAAPAEAKRLGCDPDFNAWTREPNVIPDGMERRPLRTASGHIHIGWTSDADIYDNQHFQQCIDVVKQLDIALYGPSLMWKDGNTERQKFYGAPGCFRPKHYGVEYRVLSNTWLKSDALTKWVYNQTMWAMNKLMNGHVLFEDNYPSNWSTYALMRAYGCPEMPEEVNA